LMGMTTTTRKARFLLVYGPVCGCLDDVSLGKSNSCMPQTTSPSPIQSPRLISSPFTSHPHSHNSTFANLNRHRSRICLCSFFDVFPDIYYYIWHTHMLTPSFLYLKTVHGWPKHSSCIFIITYRNWYRVYFHFHINVSRNRYIIWMTYVYLVVLNVPWQYF
jgi:hypothetical protein